MMVSRTPMTPAEVQAEADRQAARLASRAALFVAKYDDVERAANTPSWFVWNLGDLRRGQGHCRQ